MKTIQVSVDPWVKLAIENMAVRNATTVAEMCRKVLMQHLPQDFPCEHTVSTTHMKKCPACALRVAALLDDLQTGVSFNDVCC